MVESRVNPGQAQAIVLAAGKGTRMRSDLPKVVHPVGGRAMVCAVVDACLEAGCSRVVVVVGYQQEKVREALAEYGGRVEFAVQSEQLGTGHAAASAAPVMRWDGAWARTPVFVLAGDGPLIRASTLRAMLERHAKTGAAATLATSVIEDPTGYGRIVRDGSGGGKGGRFVRIVEHRDATPQERAIREVYPSYAVFAAGALFGALERVERNPGTGEYYVTEVFPLLAREGGVVEVIEAVPAEDVLSINTPEELARVDAIFRGRVRAPSAARPVATREGPA